MRGIGRCQFAGLIMVLAVAGATQASALTLEQARENCRATVGRAIVQGCKRGGSGDLESCRALAKPKVHACVQAALNAANGRANIAVAAPKEETPDLDAALMLRPTFVAPPRTIADITAILDNEKPDDQKIAQLKAEADANPPHASNRDLARFYYNRGQARARLGRLADATADALKAIEVAHGAVDANQMGRLEQFAGLQYSTAGDPKQALTVFSRQQREMNTPGAKGYMFGANREMAQIYLQMGDIAQADAAIRRNFALIHEARTSGLPGWRASYPTRGQSWETDVELGRAIMAEARGQYREAELAYRQAELRRRASLAGIMKSPNPPPASQIMAAADALVLSQARMKAKQGRFAEAEADARRALLARLKDDGKYNPATPRYVMGLADILVEQGRYGDAEKLARVSIEINRTVGVAADSQSTVKYLTSLAGILTLQRKLKEAMAIYNEIDQATVKWDAGRRRRLERDPARVNAMYASGQVESGIALAREMLKGKINRLGENHVDTATARGTLAIGLMKAGRDDEATKEFRAALPLLMQAARENANDDDTTVIAERNERLKDVVEAYITLLDRHRSGQSGDAAVETFALADAIRGHSVQQALAESSARAVVKDPALAELVRKEQDVSKQVNAQLGTLNNVLTLPSQQRDEAGVKAINAAVAALRADRDKLRGEIARKFPSYADLIDPKPPSVEQIKTTLKPGEALLSFYFGREASFVWAVPKDGPVAFASIAATEQELSAKIRKLREALEPQVAMVSDIPPFDLKLAYELYSLLLKPVEAGWKPAKSLIVVTNGALGLLPLSLLPTAPAEAKQVVGQPLFSSYRAVPWLARTHAVTMVPSASALRTLRQIPPGSAQRERMIGFGDPVFSKEQATQLADASAAVQSDAGQPAVATRGMPLKRRAAPQLDSADSAELSELPRLPDTADELKSIALALEVDPAKVLQLGVKANEQTVKSMDLSRYKIIVFATHGLVPGELNGLTQPALALSAPDVAGVDGDGLLTMEEILALRLDADWVVLSACNTGAGAGAGAEAASGLGRAFFYAGTRALLVTNWSVHSQSARDLTSDLFRRQTKDPALSRAEALRQAMMALVDGPGYVNAEGKTMFAYAHPLFWAPYTIIGDGGV